MENFISEIKSLDNPSFQAIKDIAYKTTLRDLSEIERRELWEELEHGVPEIKSHKLLCQYLSAFGNMHEAKLLQTYSEIIAKNDVFSEEFEVIDWGCGQGTGTIVLYDFLIKKGLASNIKKITLIEPGIMALERAKLHLSVYTDKTVNVESINSYFELINSDNIKSDSGRSVIHIFSNILDVKEIDLKHLANVVDNSVSSDNYLVCVGPLNQGNERLDAFYRYFDEKLISNIYSDESKSFCKYKMTNAKTFKARVYKLIKNVPGHLIPIKYYPTVQFQAAYELDTFRDSRLKTNYKYSPKLSHFEVAAPFDLGACVYDDVHPILAVANNIITRGLPTRASPYIEEVFAKLFSRTTKSEKDGTISYLFSKEFDFVPYPQHFLSTIDKDNIIPEKYRIAMQYMLSPIAIARFQKVLLEAIITEKLSIEKTEWEIMVKESDVPFAALAIKDFEMLINNLTALSKEYEHIKIPKIKLYIESNQCFAESPLHLNENVFVNTPDSIVNKTFDLVVTLSMYKSVNSTIESFSRFEARNKCYFNIRTISSARKNRTVYTSDLIKYKPLTISDSRGNHNEIHKNKELLKYFLQLIFRKTDFRPGQTPILNRALQNLPVIGLLPTGGGKSLTYQLAALLQPGITIVIDPLKSLMKDQYDGLILYGIDSIAFINSSLQKKEKEESERKLEYSELSIVFLSPERLAIKSFRDRLARMHDYNVYFSYGVIDEVHCVSEWGHDFRFSYLHLGRNLYNYVKAKNGEVSLFGLTATASFDVLADVERELSGNGAFKLDADVIVRYENTNRLELQYKIIKVPFQFDIDGFYEQNKTMPDELPKAVYIKWSKPAFEIKGEYLDKILVETPKLIKELQSKENTNFIKKSFVARINSNENLTQDLQVSFNENYYEKNSKYAQSGIVFCPHINSGGISVNDNFERIKNLIKDVCRFSGKDDDDSAIESMEKFRKNKTPLMIATKAFGMGIDKPNVRFTANMNFSSSLEAFVQEAGRAGRDGKMAIATILFSDYKLAKINRTYQDFSFEKLPIIKNKWFKSEDLQTILDYYKKTIPDEEIMYASPTSDIVRLLCIKNKKYSDFNNCNSKICNNYTKCRLAKVNKSLEGWKPEKELIIDLKAQGLNISKKHFQYLNPDYNVMMYFFGTSFKGDDVEKLYMDKILNKIQVEVYRKSNPTEVKMTGFLEALSEASIGEDLTIFIPYINDNDIPEEKKHDTDVNRASDISKAIYRMCSIELIEDFTQDYKNEKFRIIVSKKTPGEYFRGLERFLLRYYSDERASEELENAINYKIAYDGDDELRIEIYKSLAYLTEFVYDKISEKRKRAMDEMRNFCIEGMQEGKSWIHLNEELKDYIYYYFNSKYAKKDYVADNGEEYSLMNDTNEGKISNPEHFFKYLRVVDKDFVGDSETPIDNVKHLYGAVRLISRSLTDSNPVLALLEVFCLGYMGTKGNENLENQISLQYIAGNLENSKRLDAERFWKIFNKLNDKLELYMNHNKLNKLKNEFLFVYHSNKLKEITEKYTL
jgi:superfamily II DNA helicase RecQ